MKKCKHMVDIITDYYLIGGNFNLKDEYCALFNKYVFIETDLHNTGRYNVIVLCKNCNNVLN